MDPLELAALDFRMAEAKAREATASWEAAQVTERTTRAEMNSATQEAEAAKASLLSLALEHVHAPDPVPSIPGVIVPAEPATTPIVPSVISAPLEVQP